MNKLKLSDVSFVITKGTTPTTVGGKFLAKGINFVKSDSVGQFKHLDYSLFQFIDEKTDEKLKRSKLKEDDLLFSIAGAYLGKLSIVRKKDLPANTNQAVGIVRLDKSRADVNYLYYFFSQKRMNKYINNLSSQSSQPNLNLELLGNLEFDYRIIKIQKQIAKVLSDLDTKIEHNNKINRELEAMAKLLYDYWFVQFDFPDANEKPYKSSGGKMLYNEELKREIPESWGVQRLKKETKVQYGYPFSTELFSDNETGKPVIRIRDILKNTISTYSTEQVTDRYKLEKGDLVIGMDGNFHMNFWDKNNCWLNQRSLRIRDNETSLVSIYQAYLDIKPFIEAREKNVSRTTVAHLSAKDVDGLNVLVAPETKTFKHKETFDSFVKKIIANRNENQKLTELRDWLLPLLMNGQVTVAEAKEQLGMVAEDGDEYKS